MILVEMYVEILKTDVIVFISCSHTYGTKKKWPYKTVDLLKEVQFI
jgi:hypothetical protein